MGVPPWGGRHGHEGLGVGREPEVREREACVEAAHAVRDQVHTSRAQRAHGVSNLARAGGDPRERRHLHEHGLDPELAQPRGHAPEVRRANAADPELREAREPVEEHDALGTRDAHERRAGREHPVDEGLEALVVVVLGPREGELRCGAEPRAARALLVVLLVQPEGRVLLAELGRRRREPPREADGEHDQHEEGDDEGGREREFEHGSSQRRNPA